MSYANRVHMYALYSLFIINDAFSILLTFEHYTDIKTENMNEVIRLKLKVNETTIEKSGEVKNAFIEACRNLDPVRFEPLMQENEIFQDLDKWRFLESFKRVLIMAKREVDYNEVLQLRSGKCRGCQCGKTTFEFLNSSGKQLFAYMILEEAGIVTDIFLCNWSSGIISQAINEIKKNPNKESNFYESLKRETDEKKWIEKKTDSDQTFLNF